MNKKIEIPDFLVELSKQMNSDPVRCTSHPFWQVRCKRLIPTSEEHGDGRFEIIHDCESIFYSELSGDDDFIDYMAENFPDWVNNLKRNQQVEDFEDLYIDWDFLNLPSGVDKVYLQEIEQVVWTGLTQSAAEQFIARKQHDYPKLYTWVESAYWSPQLRELQDWIKGLTA